MQFSSASLPARVASGERRPRHARQGRCLPWLIGALCAALGALATAEEPLHARVDALLAQAHPAGQAPPASDADFLRRASLALHGVIPTAAQARAFFADPAPDKRAKLIETLVANPQFARWMAVRFDVMLMERRGEKHSKSAPWREYLEASFAANKPWDQLVRELLTNDGGDEKTKHLARWCLEYEGDQNALTRGVARIFLGRDIGCAQCHDHPKIDDYTQRDYAGLQAFFSRTYLFQPDTNKPGLLGERAAGEVTFTSVFTKVGGDARPHLPGGPHLAEPTVAPAEQWIVPPNDKDKNVRAVPKYSRRALLADALGNGHHPAFRRNIANRLWFVVFGRGLVEPLDLQHSGNPPADPALLDLLAESVAAMKFDMRAFIRELALTQAFQRALDLPVLPAEVAQSAANRLPVLDQEAKSLAETVASVESEFSKAREATIEVQRSAEPLKAALTKENVAAAEAKKAADAAAAEAKKFEDALAAKRDAQKALAEAAAKINEAAAKVPEAAEIAQAAKTFQAKADAVTTEMPAAEKAVADRKADVDAKTQTFTGAEQSVAAAKAKVDEAAKNVAVQQAALDAVAARKQAERTKAKQAARLAAEVKAALAWVQANAAAAPALEADAKAASAFAAVKQSTDKLTAEIAETPAKLATLESTVGTLAGEMAKAKEGMIGKRPAADALAEAAAKSAEAAAKLPNDADVKNAAAAVKTKADALAAEVAALEKAVTETQAKSDTTAKLLTDARGALEKAKADLAAAQQQLPALEAEAKAARAKAEETAAPAAQAREALAAAWGTSFASLELVPLMPEQLCWSVMQATGVLEPQRTQSEAEWDKKTPLTDADKANPAKLAERAAGIEKLYREKLLPHENQYIRAFGGGAGQPQTDFFATPEQALYFENGGVLRSWAAGLANRLAAMPEPKAMAEELYLSTLTRFPAEAESAELTSLLASRPPEKKAEAITDLAWALLTSNEFRFSH